MAAYKPTKTLLLHEQLRKNGPSLPLFQGGWDDTPKVFVPIESYAAYKTLLVADGFSRPGCEMFMDAFTAAVESGDLTSENWFGAFENLGDWHSLANDLTDGGPRWINERARQALHHVLHDVDTLPAMLTGLEAFGNGLVNAIDWAAINRKATGQSPAKPQKSRSPMTRHLKLVESVNSTAES